MTRRRSMPIADCGICVLEGPDRFGNYDPVEHPECPEHGWQLREDDPERVLPQWTEEEDRWAA